MCTLIICLEQMNKNDKTNWKLQLCNIDKTKEKVLKWYNTSEKSQMERKT